MRRGALASALAFLAACAPPKYALYRSPAGDFACEIPWGWTIFEDRQGSDYSALTFVGPFDPDFYQGLPSLSVRWYANGARHRLAGGQTESYASGAEFISRTLEEVYGPEAGLLPQEGGRDRESVAVSGRKAEHFIVLSPAPAPAGARFGVSEDASGRLANVRQHAYVVLAAGRGFYVIVYPATREGYPRYLDRFNKLVNSFAILKEGPDGPAT